MKGPAIFLAQFVSDEAPFNSLDAITKWAASLGYRGVQIPTWDARLIDLEKAAQSQDYVDEIKGLCAANGVEVTSGFGLIESWEILRKTRGGRMISVMVTPRRSSTTTTSPRATRRELT